MPRGAERQAMRTEPEIPDDFKPDRLPRQVQAAARKLIRQAAAINEDNDGWEGEQDKLVEDLARLPDGAKVTQALLKRIEANEARRAGIGVAVEQMRSTRRLVEQALGLGTALKAQLNPLRCTLRGAQNRGRRVRRAKRVPKPGGGDDPDPEPPPRNSGKRWVY